MKTRPRRRAAPPVRYRGTASTGIVRAGRERLRIAWTNAGLAYVDSADSPLADVERRLRMRLVQRAVPAFFRDAVRAVAAGKRDVEVPVDLSWASDYVQEVLSAAMRIPWGETRPYSWLAREARRPLAVRAAASAIARNPLWLFVPCHRVISRDGKIGSYGPSGIERKRRLLLREGVRI